MLRLRRLSYCVFLVLPFYQLLAQSCTPPAETASLSEPGPTEGEFWQQQLRFVRVRMAQAGTGPIVADHLRAHKLDPRRLEIFLRVIKTNRELEVWARNQGAGPFALLQTYPLTATSGKLGPKRRAGDRQVPEGFYEIDRFNPQSNYHMSLGLNYPNATDRAHGEANPGGDIFIHGGEVTVGCLPIGDIGMEEVYLLAVAARAAGQAVIPVHIFPFPLTEKELAKRAASPHQAFWRGLMSGYAYFDQHHEAAELAGLAVAGK